MPISPGGVKKSQRVQVLLQVMQHFGSLKKKEITHHVAHALSIEEDAISKPLYEDLRDLVDQGELLVTYHRPDGAVIEDFEPKIHKTAIATWSLPKAVGHVLGAGALTQHGASLAASERMKSAISVDTDSRDPDVDYVQLYFNLHAHFFGLRVLKEALNATLILGRRPKIPPRGQDKMGAHLAEIERVFGKRSLLLWVSANGVSAHEDRGRLGHLALEFESTRGVRVTDLGSSNGTSVQRLTPEEAKRLLKLGHVLGDQTMTVSWNHRETATCELKSCKPHMPERHEMPCLIQASESFRILVMG